MVVGVPEKSGNGPATLTSGAEEGQAGRPAVARTCRQRRPFVPPTASPVPPSWPACSRSARRSRATSRRATTSTTPPTRTCCAARSRSAPSWRARGSAAWARRSSRSCEASRRAAPANTNLGIALLLAPLAKAALDGGPLRARLGATLRALDVADARAAYAAIRLAGAGGLRRARRARRALGAGRRPARGDGERRRARLDRLGVRDRLRADLRDRGPRARRRARRRARACARRSSSCTCGCSTGAPDTLIARKRGADAAARVSAGAREVLARRRRAHRRRAPGAAELRRLAARAGQRAEPRDDRRPRDSDPVRRAGRGYALTPSHRVSHSS